MAHFIQIGLEVPWTLDGIRCALAAITTANRCIMREWRASGRHVPALYKSGVRYKRQPPERFLAFPTVLRRGVGDCDQLCAWRAAELREAGIDARAVPRMVRPGLMHVVVLLPGGGIEDPSKRLGMKSRKG